LGRLGKKGTGKSSPVSEGGPETWLKNNIQLKKGTVRRKGRREEITANLKGNCRVHFEGAGLQFRKKSQKIKKWKEGGASCRSLSQGETSGQIRVGTFSLGAGGRIKEGHVSHATGLAHYWRIRRKRKQEKTRKPGGEQKSWLENAREIENWG